MKKITVITLLHLCLTNIVAQSYTWKNLPIGGGGFVSAIITSKTERGLMYARTDVGGAYRWDAKLGMWVPLLDWISDSETGYLGVESLATDPNNPNKLYMLVGISYFNDGKTAILKSDDYGNTFKVIPVTHLFKAHGNGMGRQTGEKLVVDPNNSKILFCGTRSNGLYKSSNEGKTWQSVYGLAGVSTTPNENGISFVVLDPSAKGKDKTKTIFVGVSQTGNNLYRSDNGGKSFKLIENAPKDLMPHRATLASDGNLYITYADGAGPHGHWALPEPMKTGKIWKYHTKTGVWTDITPPQYTNPFGGISVDPKNPNRIVASTISAWMLQDIGYGDRFFLSNDGGTTWRDLFKNGMDIDPNGTNWVHTHAIHWAGSIEFDPFDTKKVWVTSGNGVFKTDNIDTSFTIWKFQVKGLEETVPLDMLSIKNVPPVSVIGDYDGFVHIDVSNYAPIHQPRMGTTTGLDCANLSPNVLIRVGDKMYYSLDTAKTWSGCSIIAPKGNVAVSSDGRVFLHCPERSSTLYRSDNRGIKWTPVAKVNVKEARAVADPNNSNIFYIYNTENGKMMVSRDTGRTFENEGVVGIGASKIIRTVPDHQGHMWVARYDGGLSRSTDFGKTFQKLKNVSSCSSVGIGKEAEGKTYPALYIWGKVNGTVGIHRSTDEGQTWVRINDDMHQYGGPGNGQFVLGDMNVFGRVYMSTAGRGIIMGEELTK